MEEEKKDKGKKLIKEGAIKEWRVKVNLFIGLINYAPRH
jgi:hypothetical protein